VHILTLGGSFSFGHGVDNRQTFTEILGHKLGVPVANLAYSGYGAVQALQQLERHVDLQPKIIIYGLVGDHLGAIYPRAPPATRHFAHLYPTWRSIRQKRLISIPL
jgi:hypothetical protein